MPIFSNSLFSPASECHILAFDSFINQLLILFRLYLAYFLSTKSKFSSIIAQISSSSANFSSPYEIFHPLCQNFFHHFPSVFRLYSVFSLILLGFGQLCLPISDLIIDIYMI